MEPEDLLVFTEPATGSYPGPAESSPHLHTLQGAAE
jgi:hypothetical protein